MEYLCLECGHRWLTRSTTIPRQCPKCWARAITDEAQLKLASISLKPWAYLCVSQPPPLPLPHELALFPFSLLACGSIMSKAHDSALARVNAIKLMLRESAFSQEEIDKILSSLARGEISR